MSKELQEKADQIVQELQEALQPIKDELEEMRSRKNSQGRRI